MGLMQIGAWVVLLFLAAEPALAQQRPGSLRGIDLYDAACAECHESGEQGAPKVGDRAAWSKRASQGIGSLTRSVLQGIRATPAHGDLPQATDLEFQRAVVYMVNASGGTWVEPTGPQLAAGGRDAPDVVRQYCIQCHATGFGKAPAIGDRAAWLPHLKLGIAPLVRAAARGHGEMPPRGGEASLTDTELRGAILYMAGSAKVRAAIEQRARKKR